MMSRGDQRLEHPSESLDVEPKCWLDGVGGHEQGGLLAEAIIAPANRRGDYVIVGVARDGSPNAGRPAELDAYTHDVVNGIAKKYCQPA